MKGKNPQSNTLQKPVSKKRNYEEYLSLFTFKYTPVSHETKVLMFEDYYKWALTEKEALIAEDFCQERGIPLSTWYEWMEGTPYFKKLHAYAKKAIGSRREKLAFMNKANATIFMTSAPHYDYNAPDMTWKELLEQKAALTESSSSRSEVITVEIPNFSKSPEQVAAEVHAKTKKYTKPKYVTRAETVDKEDEE